MKHHLKLKFGRDTEGGWITHKKITKWYIFSSKEAKKGARVAFLSFIF